MNLSKIATTLNTVATVGATLQASGTLNLLSPNGMAIALAVLALMNAVAHAMAPKPPAV